MKKLALFIAVALVVLAVPALAFTPEFNVAKFVVCKSIADKAPVGEATSFDSDTEKIYAFLEATDIAADTKVSIVWYFNDKEVANIELKLGKSSRWRTYSSKTIGDRHGSWKVEVVDSTGNTMSSQAFTVK